MRYSLVQKVELLGPDDIREETIDNLVAPFDESVIAKYKSGKFKLVPRMLPGDKDPILIAAGFEATSPATQTVTLGLPAPSTLVFDPSATRSENTYTTWAQIAAAGVSIGGTVNVYVPKNATVLAGAYTMPASWNLYLGASVTLTLAVGSTLSVPPGSILGTLSPTGVPSLLTGLSTTTAHFPVTSPISMIVRRTLLVMSALGPLLTTNSAATFIFSEKAGMNTTELSSFVITTGVAAPNFIFWCFDAVTIGGGVVQTVGTITANEDITSTFDVGQTATGGTTVNLIADALNLNYANGTLWPDLSSGGVPFPPENGDAALDFTGVVFKTLGSVDVIYDTSGPAFGLNFANFLSLAEFVVQYPACTIQVNGNQTIPAGDYTLSPMTTFQPILKQTGVGITLTLNDVGMNVTGQVTFGAGLSLTINNTTVDVIDADGAFAASIVVEGNGVQTSYLTTGTHALGKASNGGFLQVALDGTLYVGAGVFDVDANPASSLSMFINGGDAFIDANSVLGSPPFSQFQLQTTVPGECCVNQYIPNLVLLPGIPFAITDPAGPDPNGLVTAGAGCIVVNGAGPGTGPILWLKQSSSGNTDWAPVSQSGSSVLTNGVSGNVSAWLTANSRIFVQRSDPRTSTALGELCAITADVTIGTPGHFIIRSKSTVTPATTIVADQSAFYWQVVETN